MDVTSNVAETTNPATTIYVGNLDQRVTDTMLNEIFTTVGQVVSVKIISVRKHNNFGAVNYGFVEFADPRVAEQAIQDMNGRKIFNYEIRANWAQPSATISPPLQMTKEDTTNHFHVFVGDLAAEINDEKLSQAFSEFGTMSEAHVMWDPLSGKSRGFGFVAFRDKTDAERAIATMNGEWLGTRPIRCNWATQKGQTAMPAPQPGQQLPYEVVVQQTPAYVTSIYVGNIPLNVSQNDLVQPFQRFGYVQEVKFQADRGFAFVKMDTHENAANAIVHLQNMSINGNVTKLSWGKDRPPPGWQNYNGGFQQQVQYGRRQPNNNNAFGVQRQLANGYAFQNGNNMERQW
ncbi:hypothetical protein G6F57_004885 [Rhizopus arrhizus]|nr:hypothetical protein G6F18_003490 [Rhizopus arrhizus]KAG0888267.1 hypothetical protein G6F15_001719 [Rhizopus arrhizus]KAG1009072.1 hypothetical protein G6F27_005913 [Rhizopus arrhizus]KAG1043753.1 hypothetical protein G6F25_002172 [Rhizopus arrhizus]KAG1103243.1 hypothetical protein G6F39_002046 [Rhizopus arrhizus]